MSLREALLAVAHEAGVTLEFPPAVTAEVARIDLGVALADPALTDWTHLPFVTIDGPTSRDLDQALCIERDGNDFVVRYALADAAYFVPEGSALFEEALVRGASVYFPGFSVPMLPRELSEGLVSLNPDGQRRALSFEVRVDAAGNVQGTHVIRTVIASRAKLSFPEVQRFYDSPEGSPLRGREYEASLEALRSVGQALAAEARRRDVARYRRTETEYVVDGEALRMVTAPRLDVELYNEQLSLLVNREGARILAECPLEYVEPIYRVHPAPAAERLTALEAVIRGIVAAQELPASWVFDRQREPIAEYLERLPHEGREGRIAAAINRQAIVVNSRSSFSSHAGAHYGVGAEAYARYSAPMREIVGVFVHHEMLEVLDARGNVDPALRERVVEAANRSKDAQRKVNELVFQVFLDGFFANELSASPRPVHRGTVMGITSGKLHVELDEPQVDVKLFLRDLGRAKRGAWLVAGHDGASLHDQATGAVVVRLGDEVGVVLEGKDEKQNRWILQLA